MFTDVVGRDSYRPALMGIHFEDDCCVATDTYILVVYNQGSTNFAGKTIDVNGEECKGKFPEWKRVLPNQMSGAPVSINLCQLHKALKWHKRQADSQKDDKVAFGHLFLSVDLLIRLMNVFVAAGELCQCKFYLNEPTRPAIFESPSLTAIIMPNAEDNIEVDGERIPDTAAVFSYETIINNYAFNSWKKAEKPAELAWVC